MSDKQVFDRPSADASEQEEGTRLRPRFDAAGLVTAVVTDHASGELLMVAHMNERALEATLSTGLAHYWSRSRNTLWKKGETSGALQSVREVRVDCDQDAVWLKVAVAKPNDTCHTSRSTCFYRVVADDGQSLAVRETGDGPVAS
ncbi:phosphoribosyl-AMP cyclohydrolase [Aurantimonas sp. C2-6-R+9]|uniref:phosphoribosyl-AMP cyclohydrolase n=1 Tax=unclassified Aurantimonas TaxID=2638230 RepID=UPI002E19C22E|nr:MULTISPECIES: phosphoribosyl-AMP cyclohydrolase [unclassified Aurantimonas]MEC5291274.1 phosphoribosyl-AMP cyclohydrolase [Aurantimonas sp. C2-3-R2]MEC5381599.1 phosphoribosyl-AMP cyclohydrolase [Aurantimonas sp. C2-6-R+9]MEC5412355.1 phosphoribosyl-AMP cyclohydrolase [Aurantimonas sp. C2-4-R8]